MLLDPYGDGKNPERPNVCLTDNEPLAAYVQKGFVSHFGAFKGAKGLSNLQDEAGLGFHGVWRWTHCRTPSGFAAPSAR